MKEKGGLVVTQANCPIAIDGIQEGSKVQIFYTASKEVEVDVIADLSTVPFNGVNKDVDGDDAFGKNAKTTGEISPILVVGESTGQPYGDGNVNAFADLSAYSKLVIVATEGTPRIMLNRSIVEGQYNGEDETASALIEYPKCESSWAGKYFSVNDVDGGGIAVQEVVDKIHCITDANHPVIVNITRQATSKNGRGALLVIQRNLGTNQVREHGVAQVYYSTAREILTGGDVERYQSAAVACVGFQLERVGKQANGTVGLHGSRQRMGAVLARREGKTVRRKPLRQINVTLKGSILRRIVEQHLNSARLAPVYREVLDIKPILCCPTQGHYSTHNK